MHFIVRTACAACIGLLTACQFVADPEVTKGLLELKVQSDQQQAKINALESQSTDLRRDLTLLKYADWQIQWSDLDPADSDGYVKLKTDLGVLLVMISRVEPVADGSRVTLNVGNPLVASLLGLDIKMKFGPRWDRKQELSAWESALKEKEVSVPTRIAAGRWTEVSVLLPGTKPEDLGTIKLSIAVDGVSLPR